MRCEKNETTHTILRSSVDESDGRSVAVPDQNWIVNLELREKIRKDDQRFIVHVGDSTIFSEQVGIAGAVARIDSDRRSRGIGNARGKILPVRHRAEAFMQEYKFGSMRDASRNAEDFEAASLDGELECLGRGGGIHMRSGIVLQFDFGVPFGPREIPPYA